MSHGRTRSSSSAPARPAELLIRQAHVLDPRTGIDEPRDVLIRDGQIAELGAPGPLSAPSESADNRGSRQARLPGLRRPARAPAHARPGVQGEHRDRHDGRGGRRLLPGDRDAEHRPDGRPGQRAAGARRRPRREQAVVPTGFLASITIGLQGSELTEMAALARRRRARLHRRRQAGRLGRDAAQGAPVPAAGRRRDRAARGGSGALRRRRDARGRRLGAARRRRDPVDQRVDLRRARRRDRPVRGRARALPAPQLRRVGAGARGRASRPALASAARRRRTT